MLETRGRPLRKRPSSRKSSEPADPSVSSPAMRWGDASSKSPAESSSENPSPSGATTEGKNKGLSLSGSWPLQRFAPPGGGAGRHELLRFNFKRRRMLETSKVGGGDAELLVGQDEGRVELVGKSSVLLNYGFLDDWTSLQSALTGAAWLFAAGAGPPKAAEAFAFVHHGLAATGDHSATGLGWSDLLRVGSFMW